MKIKEFIALLQAMDQEQTISIEDENVVDGKHSALISFCFGESSHWLDGSVIE
jgi:hypothetical protein